MSLYENTRGNAPVSPAICDRCKMRRSITELVSDPNSPGIQVCGTPQRGKRQCVDDYDPYRLPARRPETITLQYPRPDVPLND